MSYEFKKDDVFTFASSIGADVREKGDELEFKYCPYCAGGDHKDKDTFSVNTKSGAFRCLRASCGRQGHFVELARDFGFELDFGYKSKKYRALPQKKPTPTEYAVKFMESRGISRETTIKYSLTTRKDNNGILVFPFYDENNLLVAVKYRNTKFKRGVDRNKEWFEKDTKPILFGMNHCDGFDRLIITEGQIDSLTVADCGFKNAVSVPTGANGFTWLTLVWDWIVKFKEIIVFGDLENGKMSLLSEISNRLPNKIRRVRSIDYLGEKDANDIYRKYGKRAIINCIEYAEAQQLKNVKDLSTVEAVDLDKLPKIKTNIREIDRVIGGFCFGQVCLLSGKRGEGKSTVASNFTAEAIEQDAPAFIYSGELTDYHFKRWLDFQFAGSANVEEFKNEYGDSVYSIKPGVVEKISNWYKGKAFIYDNSFVPDVADEYESLLDTIEKAIKQYGIKFVLVDNLMTAMEQVNDTSNLYLAQSNFVGSLKRLAVKYDVFVLLIAHPRKTNADFSNDDVSGSGDITNKVDIVMSYQRWDNPQDGVDGKLTITKNRLTGKLATGNNAIGLRYSEQTKRIFSESSEIRHYGWEAEDIDMSDFEEIF